MSHKKWNDEYIKANKLALLKSLIRFYKSFGAFFSYDENTTEVENKTERKYFPKATNIGSIKQRNIHAGFYYQHRSFRFFRCRSYLTICMDLKYFYIRKRKKKRYKGHGIGLFSRKLRYRFLWEQFILNSTLSN